MTDVFISYKREERPRCERIAAKLRSLGLDVWFDARLQSGESFDREIERAIKEAKAVLVLWSPRSIESRWVRNEANTGLEGNKLVAVCLENMTLPVAFKDVHYELLTNPQFQDDDAAWLKIVERVGKLTGRPQIVSFSEALARAALPLEEWARLHPADPLAVRMRAKADFLGGVDKPAMTTVAAPAAKPSFVPVAIAAAFCLVLGGVAGVVGGPLLRPHPDVADPVGPAPTTTTVAGTTATTVDVNTAAQSLVGRYMRGAAGQACNDEQARQIVLGDGYINVIGGSMTSTEQLLRVDAGWVITSSAGSELAYKRDGTRLHVRSGAQEVAVMEVCR